MQIIDRTTTKDKHGITRHDASNPHQLYALPNLSSGCWVTKEPDGLWIIRGANRASRIPYKGHTSERVLEPARCTCAATVRILAPQLLGIGYSV